VSASDLRATRWFEFGPYRLDPQERLLVLNREVVRLSPKAFELLLLLVSRSGHLVEKAEIKRAVWPDTYVDETNIAQHVSLVRKALQEGEQEYRFIETVPRVGYRFVADVREVASEPRERDTGQSQLAADQRTMHVKHIANSSRTTRSSSLTKLVALLAALVLVVGGLWLLRARIMSRTSGRVESIAVLPLTNTSTDESQDYLADGISEALITDLSKLGSLRVISRGSVMQYKDSHGSLTAIGRTLGVDAIVTGAVFRSGDRVRITAQLTRVADGHNIWAEQYDRSVRDIIGLQNEVATQIAEQIRVKFTPEQSRQFMVAKNSNPEAHEAYLKGRYFWNRRTESDYLTAIKYFEEAIGHDPGYAPAYAGLADSYALLGSFPNSEITRAEAMARAKTAAEEALQLDDSLAEAHTSLAFVKMHYDWDWDGAEREFQRAIQLNPSYANAYHWHAYDLMAMNRMDDAIAELRRARSIDPLSAILNADLSEALSFAGQYDDALKQGEAAVALDPSFPLGHQVLARAYLGKRMFAEAIREAERAVELAPDSPWMQSYLAQMLAYDGRKREARLILKQLRRVVNTASSAVPAIYAALGDPDAMFTELEKLYSGREGSLMLLNWEPAYASYRNDPRFRDLVRRIGLPSIDL